jgi:hypothetical protein
MKAHVLLLAAVLVSLCGCATFQYRVLQPQGVAQAITEQPAQVSFAPLEYHFAKQHDRLAVQINNPTDDTIALVGERSSVVDPAGESHPVRGRLINPRSFVRMLLPPQTISIPYPEYYWGGGSYWGPYYPHWGPYYGWYGPPPVSYYQVRTLYDWQWKTGPVRLHLTYDRKGTAFVHDFEIVREVK